jgi:hypothetical protein
MVYDAADRYVVLFGNAFGLNVTWKFANGTWTNITSLSPRSPSERAAPGMAYDAKDGYVVLFGGIDDLASPITMRADTWTFHAGKWTNISPSVGTSPTARAYMAMTYDPAIGGILAFGGLQGCSSWCTTWHVYDDTWEFSGGHWTRLAPVAHPSPRDDLGLAYDSALHGAVLYGGLTKYAGVDNDSWLYSGGNWSRLGLSPHPKVRADGMAYDPSLRAVVLFGSNASYVAGARGMTWGLPGAGWQNLKPSAAPTQRDLPIATYDGKDGYFLLFGGRDSSGNILNDTWELS